MQSVQMFVFRKAFWIFSTLYTRVEYISYETYIYAEDVEDIISFRLRKWDRRFVESFLNQRVINTLIATDGYSEYEFNSALWNAATTTLDIK